ncbi:MAG: hypothetical protein H5T78_14370 [Nocardia sp.]|nr:hypothetical protein [Nocardia sp.]
MTPSHTTEVIAAADQRLARNIAALMRTGTAVAAGLLAGGAVCGYTQAGVVAVVLLAGGCGILILLPVVRLVMMAGHFVRLADTRFVITTVAVLVLVATGGVLGVVL